MYSRRHFLTGAAGLAALPLPLQAASTGGKLETQTVRSARFDHNRIGIGPERRISVWLPKGYDGGRRRYPVIYLLPNLFDTDATFFAQYNAHTVFDQAVDRGVIGEVIVVSADFSTPLGSSLYVNSPVTGDWEDFMVRNLVPYVDGRYRTLATSASRGLLGDRMGGHGAIRFGMKHPEVFGTIYALHPVGTGYGIQTMLSRPNWDILLNAKSLDDVMPDLFCRIFTAIFQAHLPNPDKAPLFVDMPARRENGRMVAEAALVTKLQDGFFLERMIPAYAGNLKQLRGFAFDWGRNDTNYDHIYSNEAFTQQLDEYGVAHEAEAYNGGWGDRHWGMDGRVMTDAMPFFARHLVFQ